MQSYNQNAGMFEEDYSTHEHYYKIYQAGYDASWNGHPLNIWGNTVSNFGFQSERIPTTYNGGFQMLGF